MLGVLRVLGRLLGRKPGPPRTPCRAVIKTLLPMDGTGDLVTEDGVTVRFGGTACKGFVPAVGMSVWLIEYGPHPLGQGYRATVLNLTGKPERTRLVEAEEETRLAADREGREAALLDAFGLPRHLPQHARQLVALPAERRKELARALVELKASSHLYDRLFTELVTIDPEAFHPLLERLDWRAEPESLAWVRAPYPNVRFAAELLAGRGAPADDIGAAALALARSGRPEAVAELERWMAASKIAPAQANELLLDAGWEAHEGRLHRLWGERPAFRVQATAEGPVRLFEPSPVRCGACNDPLLRLIGGERDVLPFPLFTCANCVAADFMPYLVEVAADGTPVSRFDEPPGDGFEPSTRRARLPNPLTATLVSAPMAMPDTGRQELTRVGGSPTWVQYPQGAGPCPRCSSPMEFLAQFADPPTWECWAGDSGLLYVFGCLRCRLAASFVQGA